jgi:uncharacterized protein
MRRGRVATTVRGGAGARSYPLERALARGDPRVGLRGPAFRSLKILWSRRYLPPRAIVDPVLNSIRTILSNVHIAGQRVFQLMAGHQSIPDDEYGPLQLLILQANPFCNINCKYCYLPERAANRPMPLQVVEAAVRFVLDGNLVRDRLSVVWHAGEPMVVPIAFYADAKDRIANTVSGRCPITHSIQTNATMIDQSWCDFLKAAEFQVGVSLDGPKLLHDANRVTRSGRGTFDQTMRGIRLLQENGIDFHVIAVLTTASLGLADEIIEFFDRIGVSRLGFNVEEAEGVHTSPSITRDAEMEYVRFLKRFSELCLPREASRSLHVREFAAMESRIRSLAAGSNLTRSQESTPFAIVTVDSRGNISTFSPELMGNTGHDYSGFVFGNVLHDRFTDVVSNTSFLSALQDIRNGTLLCASKCQYFMVCGGGAPSNKYYENGTFVSTQTVNCRYRTQIVADLVLDRIESALKRRSGSTTH